MTSTPHTPTGPAAVVRPALLRRTRAVREAQEDQLLAPAATRAGGSRGREFPEEEHAFRTAFERDRDRVIHSKAFRRLKHKTQVFISPVDDHLVTRLTHTMKVAQVGRGIAAALGLNEPLTEAICLGHDIGHAPFGHTGERALSPFVPGEWQHAIQAVRIVRKLEPLNLTWEVRDGIRASSWKNDPPPSTPEGMACRYADRIAYLAHDVTDALASEVLAPGDVPARFVRRLGEPGRDWIDTLVTGVVEHGTATGEVGLDPELAEVMHELREFMFARVYLRPEAEEQAERAVGVIRDLVEYFADVPEEVPGEYAVAGDPPLQRAVDYVAGMTDRFAMRTHDRLFRPRGQF